MPFYNCIFIATGWESGLRIPLVRLSWSITKIPPYMALVIQNLGNQRKKKKHVILDDPLQSSPMSQGDTQLPLLLTVSLLFQIHLTEPKLHLPMSLHPRSYPRKETSPSVLSPLELPITRDQGSYALLGKWQMGKGQSESPFITNLAQSKQTIF